MIPCPDQLKRLVGTYLEKKKPQQPLLVRQIRPTKHAIDRILPGLEFLLQPRVHLLGYADLGLGLPQHPVDEAEVPRGPAAESELGPSAVEVGEVTVGLDAEGRLVEAQPRGEAGDALEDGRPITVGAAVVRVAGVPGPRFLLSGAQDGGRLAVAGLGLLALRLCW